MTVNYAGLPWRTQTNLPTPLNVASTTNATPIVATTTAPHSLAPGDYFLIEGATDTAANGAWRAGTVTGTTVVLLIIPGGGNSAGAGGGGAAGTLQALGFGVTVPILTGGDKPVSALWNVPYEALLDRTAYLIYVMQYAITILRGGSITLANGSALIVDSGAAIVAASGSEIDAQDGSFTTLNGRKVLRRSRGATLSDANHSIEVGTRDIVYLTAAPAALRTITILSTNTDGSPPDDEESIEVITDGVTGIGQDYLIKREDGTLIAEFWGTDTIGHATYKPVICHARFDWTGGVWRMGPCVRMVGATGDGYGGVVAGAGA